MASLEKIVALAKRRGFLYPSSDIYGGLAGVWDFGPMGVALKRNVENLWWNMFVSSREDMYGLDAGILMHPKVWEASGHVSGFSDPMVECASCGKRSREDHGGSSCTECGGAWKTETQQFNLMFQTRIGASKDSSATAYLRPETAQGMFVNFKNILDTMHPKLPFGLAQIGKAFRNEINPRDFIFRVREFSQMEIEYFVRPDRWEEEFEMWRSAIETWVRALGIDPSHIHELEVPDGERAHYSKRTIDIEYDYPFGRSELLGLAYRTNYDLLQHMNTSGVSLEYFDDLAGARFVPHVIEPSFGLERTVLALLSEHYREDALGEGRVYLSLPKALAPVEVAVFPLLKNKPELVKKARAIFESLKVSGLRAAWDDDGNIGKRYRRQDEIGTPACVTIDFETLENDTVTVRDRNTGKQERATVADIAKKLAL